jgi:hypothetical protein
VRAAIGRSSASPPVTREGTGCVWIRRAARRACVRGGARVAARTKVRELEVDEVARELDERVTQPNEVAAALVHLRRGGAWASSSCSARLRRKRRRCRVAWGDSVPGGQPSPDLDQARRTPSDHSARCPTRSAQAHPRKRQTGGPTPPTSSEGIPSRGVLSGIHNRRSPVKREAGASRAGGRGNMAPRRVVERERTSGIARPPPRCGPVSFT